MRPIPESKVVVAQKITGLDFYLVAVDWLAKDISALCVKVSSCFCNESLKVVNFYRALNLNNNKRNKYQE